jgi:Uncharacterized protein conserved in bacteria (DUF2330)
MNRSALVLGVSAAAAACALALVGEREAKACGGCFHPPTQVTSDITDERMLLAVSPTQTTLYDQIRYSGSPTSFAWVLPIHGTVEVGLSADVLFAAVDTLTTTQIPAPPSSCPAPPNNCNTNSAFGSAAPGAAGSSSGGGDKGGVTVTKQENVGPYATVQLHSTDSSALENWLAQNGYQIPADVKPIIGQYVTEGFDFLAMKLLPNQGIQAMRPVRVTAPGASVSLPLRMAAIGTGASVGITIWVVSDGRYEPQNFPFYHIEDKDLVWDWTASASNYTTLRSLNETKLAGKGWELESSLTLNQELISNVILSGGVYYGGGGTSAGPPAPASDDYLPISGDDGGTSVPKTAEQVRTADVGALFAGISVPNVRVTRMRSDISHAAMTTDFVLQASSDQAELSNVRVVTQSVNETCAIYQGCDLVGYGTPTQANAAAANNTGGKESFGCAATPRRTNAYDFAFALAGGVGLVLVRVVRLRRSQKRKD